MLVAPASSEFSTSSFTTELTEVITCELAISRMVDGGKRFITLSPLGVTPAGDKKHPTQIQEIIRMFTLNRKRIQCSGQLREDVSTGKIPKTVFILFRPPCLFCAFARESYIDHMINYRNADEVVRTITDIHEYHPKIRRRACANKVTSDTFDCSMSFHKTGV